MGNRASRQRKARQFEVYGPSAEPLPKAEPPARAETSPEKETSTLSSTLPVEPCVFGISSPKDGLVTQLYFTAEEAWAQLDGISPYFPVSEYVHEGFHIYSIPISQLQREYAEAKAALEHYLLYAEPSCTKCFFIAVDPDGKPVGKAVYTLNLARIQAVESAGGYFPWSKLEKKGFAILNFEKKSQISQRYSKAREKLFKLKLISEDDAKLPATKESSSSSSSSEAEH
jgi:hypothetical protein